MPGQPPTVLLDTNFLLIPIRFRVDILQELERLLVNPRIVVPSPVVDELRALSQRRKISEQKEADFALRIVERCEVIEAEPLPDESVDDLILRVASEQGLIVGTTDGGLRRRLRDRGVPVVYLRQRSFLDIEGYSP